METAENLSSSNGQYLAKTPDSVPVVNTGNAGINTPIKETPLEVSSWNPPPATGVSSPLPEAPVFLGNPAPAEESIPAEVEPANPETPDIAFQTTGISPDVPPSIPTIPSAEEPPHRRDVRTIILENLAARNNSFISSQQGSVEPQVPSAESTVDIAASHEDTVRDTTIPEETTQMMPSSFPVGTAGHIRKINSLAELDGPMEPEQSPEEAVVYIPMPPREPPVCSLRDVAKGVESYEFAEDRVKEEIASEDIGALVHPVTVEHIDAYFLRHISMQEFEKGTSMKEKKFDIPLDTPLSDFLKLVSNWTQPVEFAPGASISFTYHPSNAGFISDISDAPAGTMGFIAKVRPDEDDREIPLKNGLLTFSLGNDHKDTTSGVQFGNAICRGNGYLENEIDKYMEDMNGKIQSLFVLFGDFIPPENQEATFQRMDELRADFHFSMNEFRFRLLDSIGQSLREVGSDISDSELAKKPVEKNRDWERIGRWTRRDEDGILLLESRFTDNWSPARTVRKTNLVEDIGIGIDILADLLEMEDIGAVRKLVRRVEKIKNREYGYSNPRNSFFSTDIDRELSPREEKSVYENPLGYITLEGFFETLSYGLGVRGNKYR